MSDNTRQEATIDTTDLLSSVSKKQSIKNRLQKYFLLISLSIIFLMSAFSLYYFYNTTMKESTTMIRNKLLLADLFLQEKKNDTTEFAKNLAANRSIQLGLELESGIKVSEYLESLEQSGGVFRVMVFDAYGQHLTDASGTSFSSERSLIMKALPSTYPKRFTE